MAKVAGTSYGEIDSVTVSRCSGGTAAVSGLPWPVVYNAILGALPERGHGRLADDAESQLPVDVRGIDVPIRRRRHEPTRRHREEPLHVDAIRGAARTASPLVSGGFLCPRTGTMSGTFGSRRRRP